MVTEMGTLPEPFIQSAHVALRIPGGQSRADRVIETRLTA